MKRVCVDCSAPISRCSGGRCRKCAALKATADPEIVARRAAATSAALKGKPSPLRRPVPDDFAQRAASATNTELGKHYDASRAVILRWRREVAVPTPCYKGAPPKPERIPPPADLRERARTMTFNELRRHYGRSQNLVRRWLNEAGIEAASHKLLGGMFSNRVKGAGLNFRCSVPRNAPVAIKRAMSARAMMEQPKVDDSPVGRAARVLRHGRDGAPCYRCDFTGKMVEDGAFWRWGNAYPLTDEEVMERAARRGWQPDGQMAA